MLNFALLLECLNYYFDLFWLIPSLCIPLTLQTSIGCSLGIRQLIVPNLDFASLLCHWNASLSWLPQASCITSANALEAARRPSAGRLQSKKDPQLPTPLLVQTTHIHPLPVPRGPHTADLVSRKRRSSGIAFCQYHCGMKNFKRQNWGEEKKYSDTRKAIQTVATWKNDRYFRPFLLSSGQKALYVPQLRRGREREREIYIYTY